MKLYKEHQAPCAISWSNSGCIHWSQTPMETLHLFQHYCHLLKPKKNPNKNTTKQKNQPNPKINYWNCVFNSRAQSENDCHPSVLPWCLKTKWYSKFLLHQLEQTHFYLSPPNVEISLFQSLWRLHFEKYSQLSSGMSKTLQNPRKFAPGLPEPFIHLLTYFRLVSEAKFLQS